MKMETPDMYINKTLSEVNSVFKLNIPKGKKHRNYKHVHKLKEKTPSGLYIESAVLRYSTNYVFRYFL